MTSETSRAVLYECQECQEVSEDRAQVALYECAECGTKFSKNNGLGKGHICPERTNKMGSKIADSCCAACEAGEVEEIDAIRCEFCDDVIVDSEFRDHVITEHSDDAIDSYLASRDLG